MGEYRNRNSGEVMTMGQIRKLFSNVSLPKVWNQNVFDSLGIDPVLITPKPETTGYTQAVRDGATQDANGNWVQAWKIVDMFADYTDDEGVVHTKAEQEAEYQARLDAEAKASAIAQINQTFEEEIAAIKEGYTEDEIKSWDQQLSEAIAYQNDQTAQTPLLDAILTNRGGTKDELVLRIATNAMQYADVFGKALGKKQKAIADLG